jgi:lycopene cyclase domain-containing protein
MDDVTYLALLLGCILVTLPLEFVYRFRVWRDPKRLLRALAPGFVVFVVWDIYAIERGHWTYNPDYMSGLGIGSMPLEELLFFLVIPTAAISGYEAVCAGLQRHRGDSAA